LHYNLDFSYTPTEVEEERKMVKEIPEHGDAGFVAKLSG